MFISTPNSIYLGTTYFNPTEFSSMLLTIVDKREGANFSMEVSTELLGSVVSGNDCFLCSSVDLILKIECFSFLLIIIFLLSLGSRVVDYRLAYIGDYLFGIYLIIFIFLESAFINVLGLKHGEI